MNYDNTNIDFANKQFHLAELIFNKSSLIYRKHNNVLVWAEGEVNQLEGLSDDYKLVITNHLIPNCKVLVDRLTDLGCNYLIGKLVASLIHNRRTYRLPSFKSCSEAYKKTFIFNLSNLLNFIKKKEIEDFILGREVRYFYCQLRMLDYRFVKAINNGLIQVELLHPDGRLANIYGKLVDFKERFFVENGTNELTASFKKDLYSSFKALLNPNNLQIAEDQLNQTMKHNSKCDGVLVLIDNLLKLEVKNSTDSEMLMLIRETYVNLVIDHKMEPSSVISSLFSDSGVEPNENFDQAFVHTDLMKSLRIVLGNSIEQLFLHGLDSIDEIPQLNLKGVRPDAIIRRHKQLHQCDELTDLELENLVTLCNRNEMVLVDSTNELDETKSFLRKTASDYFKSTIKRLDMFFQYTAAVEVCNDRDCTLDHFFDILELTISVSEFKKSYDRNKYEFLTTTKQYLDGKLNFKCFNINYNTTSTLLNNYIRLMLENEGRYNNNLLNLAKGARNLLGKLVIEPSNNDVLLLDYNLFKTKINKDFIKNKLRRDIDFDPTGLSFKELSSYLDVNLAECSFDDLKKKGCKSLGYLTALPKDELIRETYYDFIEKREICGVALDDFKTELQDYYYNKVALFGEFEFPSFKPFRNQNQSDLLKGLWKNYFEKGSPDFRYEDGLEQNRTLGLVSIRKINDLLFEPHSALINFKQLSNLMSNLSHYLYANGFSNSNPENKRLQTFQNNFNATFKYYQLLSGCKVTINLLNNIFAVTPGLKSILKWLPKNLNFLEFSNQFCSEDFKFDELTLTADLIDQDEQGFYLSGYNVPISQNVKENKEKLRKLVEQLTDDYNSVISVVSQAVFILLSISKTENYSWTEVFRSLLEETTAQGVKSFFKRHLSNTTEEQAMVEIYYNISTKKVKYIKFKNGGYAPLKIVDLSKKSLTRTITGIFSALALARFCDKTPIMKERCIEYFKYLEKPPDTADPLVNWLNSFELDLDEINSIVSKNKLITADQLKDKFLGLTSNGLNDVRKNSSLVGNDYFQFVNANMNLISLKERLPTIRTLTGAEIQSVDNHLEYLLRPIRRASELTVAEKDRLMGLLNKNNVNFKSNAESSFDKLNDYDNISLLKVFSQIFNRKTYTVSDDQSSPLEPLSYKILNSNCPNCNVTLQELDIEYLCITCESGLKYDYLMPKMTQLIRNEPGDAIKRAAYLNVIKKIHNVRLTKMMINLINNVKICKRLLNIRKNNIHSGRLLVLQGYCQDRVLFARGKVADEELIEIIEMDRTKNYKFLSGDNEKELRACGDRFVVNKLKVQSNLLSTIICCTNAIIHSLASSNNEDLYNVEVEQKELLKMNFLELSNYQIRKLENYDPKLVSSVKFNLDMKYNYVLSLGQCKKLDTIMTDLKYLAHNQISTHGKSIAKKLTNPLKSSFSVYILRNILISFIIQSSSKFRDNVGDYFDFRSMAFTNDKLTEQVRIEDGPRVSGSLRVDYDYNEFNKSSFDYHFFDKDNVNTANAKRAAEAKMLGPKTELMLSFIKGDPSYLNNLGLTHLSEVSRSNKLTWLCENAKAILGENKTLSVKKIIDILPKSEPLRIMCLNDLFNSCQKKEGFGFFSLIGYYCTHSTENGLSLDVSNLKGEIDVGVSVNSLLQTNRYCMEGVKPKVNILNDLIINNSLFKIRRVLLELKNIETQISRVKSEELYFETVNEVQVRMAKAEVKHFDQRELSDVTSLQYEVKKYRKSLNSEISNLPFYDSIHDNALIKNLMQHDNNIKVKTIQGVTNKTDPLWLIFEICTEPLTEGFIKKKKTKPNIRAVLSVDNQDTSLKLNEFKKILILLDLDESELNLTKAQWSFIDYTQFVSYCFFIKGICIKSTLEDRQDKKLLNLRDFKDMWSLFYETVNRFVANLESAKYGLTRSAGRDFLNELITQYRSRPMSYPKPPKELNEFMF